MKKAETQSLAVAGQAKADKKLSAEKMMKKLVNQMLPEITRAVPTSVSPERFARSVLTAISKTPELAKCNPPSFMVAMLNAAQLGLEPNTPLGKAYLIPYGKECTLQLGYKGLIDLANRSDIKVYSKEVYANDDIDIQYGFEPHCIHKPSLSDRGEVIGYYALWKDKDGDCDVVYMTKGEIEEHAKKTSQSYENGPWQKWFDEMAKKTVIKRVLKYAPMQEDMARAMTVDGTSQKLYDDNETDFNIVCAFDENGEEIPAEQPEEAPKEAVESAQLEQPDEDPKLEV